jgi:hypothetical protein
VFELLEYARIKFQRLVAPQHKRWKELALVKAERENFGQVYQGEVIGSSVDDPGADEVR